MKALFLKWRQAFEQLTQRERMLIGVSSIAIVTWLAWLPVESALQTVKKEKQQLHQIKTEIDVAQQINDSFQVELLQDPNEKFQKQLDDLNQRQQALEVDLQQRVVDMVPAEQMPALLEKILQKTQGIKLLALASIPPTALLNTDVKGTPNLYRHGIKLKLSTTYFDFLNFVEAIDKMPKKLYWQRLDYQVKSFPEAEVELELYSLSLSEEFIRVAKN